MRYSAAYLLAILGGNPSPDVAAIAKIMGSVGIECDEQRAQKVIDACKGRDVNEIIAEGLKKIDGIGLTSTPMVTPTPTHNQTGVHTEPSDPNDVVNSGTSTPSTPGSDPGMFDLFE
ncbi:unnamed protein product [Rotaria sordida]|uniref:Large ribosomal subunit protein P2 n=1 Tax=Rotaria sordida TaxID=392033 RepID=A0A814Q2N6_9BILA|nr:unnamed protein product [Rotaria sordida]CAF0976668.1 unnamed protein product [Rotaria sordida]CAF1013138.1 unnamed protein product [Rotaria sordida]CAF1114412.1 unnamed protein product [Rotaria sordida]CAF3802473.1 unnamed protein product [Rotaria sordida]